MEKNVNLFQRDQIIDLQEANKITKKIAETKIGLGTVQGIIATWKDNG